MIKAVEELATMLNGPERSIPIGNGYKVMLAAAPSPPKKGIP
jgi:hypothetical protein